MKHIKLFEQFVQDLNESMSPSTQLLIYDEQTERTTWAPGINQKTILNAVRKLLSADAKKALAGAYLDDIDIVNKKTSETIYSIRPGDTLSNVVSAVDYWAKQNSTLFVPKNKSVANSDLIEIKSDTRAIITVDNITAEDIKKLVHDAREGIKVRIMNRKDGAKVYIDTKNREGLNIALDKVRDIAISREIITEGLKYITPAGKLKGKVYHAGGTEISKLSKDPMWFALEKSHSDEGWFKNMIVNSGGAFQYEATVLGKIGNINDEDVFEIFDKIGEDPIDWEIEIVGNPSASEVMKLKGTQALVKAGYSGIVYMDYDPRNFQADLEALIVFNPAQNVKNFKLIKKA